MCFTLMIDTMLTRIQELTTNTIIMRILYNTQYIDSWCQIVLDLLDLTFAELFYGFPHIIAWIVVWIPPEHFETQTPENFITIIK